MRKHRAASPPSRPRPLVLVIIAFVSLFAIALYWRVAGTPVDRRADDTTLVEFPPEKSPLMRAIAAADFAGDAVCADCHQDQFAKWKRSTHGRAGGRPGAVGMIAPFNGEP